MGLVRVDMRKWPDRPHWQLDAIRLGSDDFGTWIHVPSGTVAQRGDDPPRPLTVGFVAVVPQGVWWVAEFYRHHPRHSVYVNIGTPPVWHGDRLSLIDVDLDVVRTTDGAVELLDEHEFAENRRRLRYPAWLVDGARAATAAAAASLDARAEPFGEAAEPWLDAVEPSTLGWK